MRPTRDVETLIEIMARLRTPGLGCDWDLRQTFATIAPYTIEEAYEVADAIERGDLADLREELGDLLLQVVFHARMAEEQDAFDFGDVVEAISHKLIRRHPHVFGDPAERSEDGSAEAWARIKAQEASEKHRQRSTGAPVAAPSVLDGVVQAAPALMRAQKLSARAAQAGFEWRDTREVLDKLGEELAEVEQAIAGADQAAMAEEIGDVLFTVVNLARRLGVDAETALRQGHAKFERRFRALESALAAQGTPLEVAGLEAMEALWAAAKDEERRPPDEGQESRRAPL